MTPLGLKLHDEKRLCLRGVDSLVAHCLYELPEILAMRDKPGVRERLYPDLLKGDDKANADWREYVGPDLHHLFASAGETVERDLTALENEQIIFPMEHVNAWMSALNQVRLILAELHQFTEADQFTLAFDFNIPRDKALFQMEVYAEILYLFVRHAQKNSV